VRYEILNESRDPDHALSGMIFIGRVGRLCSTQRPSLKSPGALVTKL